MKKESEEKLKILETWGGNKGDLAARRLRLKAGRQAGSFTKTSCPNTGWRVTAGETNNNLAGRKTKQAGYIGNAQVNQMSQRVKQTGKMVICHNQEVWVTREYRETKHTRKSDWVMTLVCTKYNSEKTRNLHL